MSEARRGVARGGRGAAGRGAHWSRLALGCRPAVRVVAAVDVANEPLLEVLPAPHLALLDALARAAEHHAVLRRAVEMVPDRVEQPHVLGEQLVTRLEAPPVVRLALLLLLLGRGRLGARRGLHARGGRQRRLRVLLLLVAVVLLVAVAAVLLLLSRLRLRLRLRLRRLLLHEVSVRHVRSPAAAAAAAAAAVATRRWP